MEFCKKCDSIMVPVKKRKHTYLKCDNCGYEIKKGVKRMKIKNKTQVSEDLVILDDNKVNLPMIEKECPKCEHHNAYWWMQQTRGQDEPPAQVFKCEKCNHTWREHK